MGHPGLGLRVEMTQFGWMGKARANPKSGVKHPDMGHPWVGLRVPGRV
jgi:hypothetical protein